MFKMHQGVFRYILSILVLLLFAMKTQAQEVSEPLDSIIKTLKLKEVVVKAKKIRQSGDTISYAASSYISKDDKVLEDLLRKMPGVEVIGNGQIKYNGQWVNEFYIEGADMLGDNYGEATKNLDAKAIGSVQIMENHQNIKLFQGTKSGNAPAMNIKLKQTAKGAWTAMLSVAVGGQPKLARNMTLNLMNFRRNSQNLTLLKTNNVGDDLRKEINASSSLNSVLGAGILLPDKPAVSDLYAYRNDSYSASINQLYKLDKDRTLSFNVNYLYDQEKQNATDESRYLLDDGTRYVIQESNQALVGQHFVGGHVAYKLNSSKSYLKNNLSVNASFPKNEGLVNDFVSQTLSGHSFLLSNVMKANYKKKNGGVADLEWKASFADKRGVLNMSETKMSQLLRQRNFQSEATGSLLAFTIPHLMFNLNGKVMFDWQRVSAGLNSLSDASGSEQKTWLLGAFVSPKILLHFGNRLQWLVYVPVGVKYYHSADGSLDYDKRFFSTCPYSNLTYKPTGRLSFDLTTICEESMPSVLSQMVLKHYVNYRTTMSNPLQVEIAPNRSVKLAFTSSYKDIIKMLFGGVTLSYVDARNGNSMGYQVVDDVVNYIVQPQSTKNRVWQIEQTVAKGFFRWNSKISESLSIGTSRSEYYVGGDCHDGRSDYLQAKISYVASVWKWLNLSISNDYSVSKPYTDGKASGDVYRTFMNASSFTFWLGKQLNVVPSVQYYHNNYFSSGRNNVFLNTVMEYYWGNATVSLKCTNLLDRRTFHRIIDNGITRYSGEYQLRGRTILFGILIKII